MARVGRAVSAGFLAVGGVCLLAMGPPWHGTGVADPAADRGSEFMVAGDGSLPTERPRVGSAREQLSTEELGYAVHRALADPSIPADATGVGGDPGAEVLFADLHSVSTDSTARVVAVALYDYTASRTHRLLVDLNADRIFDREVSTRAQLPITPDEADAAISTAIAQGELPFLGEFERLEGVPLLSGDQVSYVAGAWSYNQTTVGGRECGRSRCAQLLVATPSGVYLDTSDFVVNLGDASVVLLREPQR